MASKHSRHTPSPTSPTQHSSASTSKLPKFLQRQNRDRSKSVTDPTGSTGGSSIASSASGNPNTHTNSDTTTFPSTPSSKIRKGSKFLGRRDKDKDKDKSEADKASNATTPTAASAADMDEAPVIVEPVAIPRPRSTADRPLTTSAPDSLQRHQLSSSSTAPSSTRIGDLPTRLSGWFSHTFSSSTTDLSLNTLLSQSSPKSKASALLTVAKHGKGHLDKAMRYLLDSDATPDKCTEPIWLLGVQHPGYEPPSPVSPQGTMNAGRRVGSPPSFRSSTSSVASNAELALALSQQPASASTSSSSSSSNKNNPAALWPPVFYIDFVSRVWLTYRSHFSQPIKDTTLTELCALGATSVVEDKVVSPAKSRWHWGGEKTWSSDSGWGCMLRTGQSLLANALIHAHLGRDWRRPPYPIYTADYATYVQILTWFFDTPSPEAPFSVHRMALAGKELGTDVGQWFGPSVAAGAIKRLVNAFPGAGLGVSVAKDGVLSQTDVFLASHTHPPESTTTLSPRKSTAPSKTAPPTWGDRPVLVLIGLRLGIDGVNPIYYETIKTLFTFPQSIGIAGGRPSSSYYFVGSQADNLFYLDPHNPRPAIPLRPLPFGEGGPAPILRERDGERDGESLYERMRRRGSKSQREKEREGGDKEKRKGKGTRRDHASYHTTQSHSPTRSSHSQTHGRIPTSPTSSTSGRASSGGFPPSSYHGHGHTHEHAPASPSPLQRELSGEEVVRNVVVGAGSGEGGEVTSEHGERITTTPAAPIPISVVLSQSSSTSNTSGTSASTTNTTSTNASAGTNNTNTSSADASASPSASTSGGAGGLDALQEHYVTSYSAAELKTYHCERVRKMPLSGLDPSMLLGFLCRDVEEWVDLRRRVDELPRSIFSIQDDHPKWAHEDFDDESMMGLESMSEPDVEDDEEDELDMDLGDEGEAKRKRRTEGSDGDDDVDDNVGDDDDEEFYEPPVSVSRSTSTSSQSQEGDTEEDPVEALTPGPTAKFDFGTPAAKGKRQETVDTLKPDSHEREEEAEEESDIEDGWVDSGDLGFGDEGEVEAEGEGEGVVTPMAGSTIAVAVHQPPSPRTPKSPQQPQAPEPSTITGVKESSKSGGKSKSSKSGSSSKSKSHTKAKSDTDSRERERKKKKDKDKKAVPVPLVSLPSGISRSTTTASTATGHQQQESYPFPGSGDGEFEDEPVEVSSEPGTRSWERGRYESQSWVGGSSGGSTGLRMFAGKGRDGGRTQSGGVKGILTDVEKRLVMGGGWRRTES